MGKEILNIFTQWKKEAGVEDIILFGCVPNLKNTIKVYVNKPGLMIGKDGCLLKKYASLLKEYNPDLISIEFGKMDSLCIKAIR